MNKKIWKAGFFITLTVFAVLSAIVIFSVCKVIAQINSPQMNIIGGADLPTFLFLLRKSLSPIFSFWFSSLLTVVIFLIGWRCAKE